MLRAGLLLGALVLALGCGDDDGGVTYSCSWKDAAGPNAGTCLYYSVSVASADKQDQVQQLCEVSDGVYAEARCPASDVLGRCVQLESAEVEIVTTYYTSFDGGGTDAREAAKQECAAIPGRWEDAL